MLFCLSSVDRPWAILDCTICVSGIVLGRVSSAPGVPALDDPTAPKLLSRRHVRLSPRPDGGLEVEDLKSLNGTFIQGPLVEGHAHWKRLPPHTPRVLASGETLLLGGKDAVLGPDGRYVNNPFKFLVSLPCQPSNTAAGAGQAGMQQEATIAGVTTGQPPCQESAGHHQQQCQQHQQLLQQQQEQLQHQQQLQQQEHAAVGVGDSCMTSTGHMQRAVLQPSAVSNGQQQQQQQGAQHWGIGSVVHGVEEPSAKRHRGQPAPVQQKQGSWQPQPPLPADAATAQPAHGQQTAAAVAGCGAGKIAAAAACAGLGAVQLKETSTVLPQPVQAAAAAAGTDSATTAAAARAPVQAADDEPPAVDRPQGSSWRSSPQRAAAAAAARRAAAVDGGVPGLAAGGPPTAAGGVGGAAAASVTGRSASAGSAPPEVAAAAAAAAAATATAASDPPLLTPPSTRRCKRQQQQQQRPPSSNSKELRRVRASNMECAICRELLVATHALGCGHMFCGLCLAQFLELQAAPTCPTCRAAVTSAPVRLYNVDNIVAEAVLSSGSEPQQLAARKDSWDAIGQDATARWQQMFSGGNGRAGSRKRSAPAAAAAAAGDGRNSAGARGTARGERAQQERTADPVQLQRGDLHLLTGLRQPAAAAAGVLGPTAGRAARASQARPRQNNHRRGGRRPAAATGVQARPQQQQQQQQRAAAGRAAGAAAGGSRPAAAAASAQQRDGDVGAADAANRPLRQLGIDAFIN